MSKVKICGLKRPEDIEIVNELRPDYCGFIVNFPKSHRSLTPQQVKELAGELDREAVKAVGVFVDAPVHLVAEMLEDGTIDMAQLHGNETESYIEQLKELTKRPVIKAFRIADKDGLKSALSCSADYILLDGGQGSGQTFDWGLIGDRGELERRRWFLAGGLDESNIAQAIARLRPFAVDLSSAVETDQVKDKEKIRRIIEIVRRESQ